MKTSESIDEITKAMCKFQSKLPTVPKTKQAFKYKYAPLEEIWETIRPLIEEHGIFIFQDVVTTVEGVKISTRINHISGQWMETDYLLIPMGKNDAHSTGSACTYGKRYSLSAALGIVCDDDDDGQAAQKNAPTTRPEPPIPCSQEEYDSFVSESSVSLSYDRDVIEEFITKRSTHFKVDPKITVSLLLKDIGKFEREFVSWTKKNNVGIKNED